MPQNKINESVAKQPNFFQTFWKFKGFRIATYIISALIILSVVGTYLITRVFSSPEINNPKIAHFHYRQVIVLNGQDLDFSKDQYQVPISQGGCTVKLPVEPIHFHDENGQFVHIHWEGVTGGEVLKNYGINYIGGFDNLLGFRFDDGHFFEPLKVHGQFFSKSEYSNKTLFIYVGDANSYSRKDKNDYLYKPLIDFFGNNNTSTTSFLDSINTYAQESNSTSPADQKVKEARQENPEKYKNLTDDEVKKQIGVDNENLKAINNVKGDLVIFIQDNEPSSNLIKEKFNSLKPLPLSLCGG